jgi:hypothetical protein
MGLERTIRLPADGELSWKGVNEQLVRAGIAASIRMIDGLPAFPDEDPSPDWREIRIGTSAGMVTIRRSAGTVSCVIWGTGDQVLTDLWMKVIWACAAASAGLIESPSGPLTADEFWKSIQDRG